MIVVAVAIVVVDPMLDTCENHSPPSIALVMAIVNEASAVADVDVDDDAGTTHSNLPFLQ